MLIPTSLKPIRLRHGEAGFSLLETVVATGILAGALAALGQMFAVSVANNHSARSGSYATVLGEQKMEQLRGLTWGFDTLGLPNTDSTTDTAAAVEIPTGTGLSPSPGGTLTSNIAGYVDYVDRFGNMLGGGETIPPRAGYIRRWSVEPLPQSPNNTLVLQVLVTQRANRGSADANRTTQRLPDEARLVSVKTRKAP